MTDQRQRSNWNQAAGGCHLPGSLHTERGRNIYGHRTRTFRSRPNSRHLPRAPVYWNRFRRTIDSRCAPYARAFFVHNVRWSRAIREPTTHFALGATILLLLSSTNRVRRISWLQLFPTRARSWLSDIAINQPMAFNSIRNRYLLRKGTPCWRTSCAPQKLVPGSDRLLSSERCLPT